MSNPFELPWVKHLSPEIVDIGAGSLTLAINPGEEHINHNGDLTAGNLFAMSEMAGMGAIVMMLGDKAAEKLVVCKNGNIDFVAPASGRISFSASLSEAQQQAIQAALESGDKIEERVVVEAKQEDGTLVAKATITSFIK